LANDYLIAGLSCSAKAKAVLVNVLMKAAPSAAGRCRPQEDVTGIFDRCKESHLLFDTIFIR